MNLDSILKRIKVKGRPMSRNRLTWWLVIGLTKLFGREVEIEGMGGKTMRLLPIVWNKKVHLLGAEHDCLQLDFTGPYTVRARLAPACPVTSGNVLPPTGAGAGGSIVHLILCHLPAQATEAILRHAQDLAPNYVVMLAYGGKREYFDETDWPHKIFLDDPSLRGASFHISYLQLSGRFRDYVKQAGIKPEWVLVSDYDMFPLKQDYLRGPIELMVKHGASLGGKLIREVSLSNQLFLTLYLAKAKIFDALNGDAQQSFHQCLGCSLLFSGDCLETLYVGDEILGLAMFEVGVLTAAKRKGYRLLSFDLHGDYFKYIRYRPVYSPADALKAAAEGASFVHPVKQTDQFLAQWKAVAPVAGVTEKYS